MDLQPEDYKELPNRAIMQYPLVEYVKYSLQLLDIYQGEVDLDPSIGAGLAYNFLIPQMRQNAKAYFIKWNLKVYADVVSSGTIGIGRFSLFPLWFVGFKSGNIAFNEIPYLSRIYPDLQISGMTENLNKITLKDMLKLFFTVNGSDYQDTTNFIPDPASSDNIVKITIKPVVHAIF